MATEREELIPDPPLIRLPQIRVEKWFWIGLVTLALPVGFAIAALNGWGPPNPFDPAGVLGRPGAAMAILTAHPAIGWPFLYAFGLVSPAQVVVASIVLLWIAFARPYSPDRVAFVPAVTLTAWIVAAAAAWIFRGFYHGPFVFDGGLISYGLTVSLAGCGAIALAARGLQRPLPRAMVSALCGLAVVLNLVFEAIAGTSPALVVASALLGMAVLAFGFEVAERSGAALFTFDAGLPGPEEGIRHLRIVEYVLLGVAGVVICSAIGYGLMLGTVHSPAIDMDRGGEMVSRAMAAALLVGKSLRSPFLWVPVAAFASWIAFAKPALSERMLFASGTIAGAVFLFPNIDAFFGLPALLGGAAVPRAAAGYPTVQVAYALAAGLALVVAARGLKPAWRRAVEIAGFVVPACVFIALLVVGVPLLHLIGGLVLGAAGAALALAIARRAGVDVLGVSSGE